ncbi:hypothetical protein BDQ12DRAFT_620263 [Crucibulum laeve]|uniref:GDP-fucose protein O-fucosyltransferase 2 n=1 Tax=Crucibulum laeve TaxID=68775 RepID=A0A5C3MFX4_9AGAR|nr:hypothetical protein BDQ12DRAFT_620263 [Crucibulum laeve]
MSMSYLRWKRPLLPAVTLAIFGLSLISVPLLLQYHYNHPVFVWNSQLRGPPVHKCAHYLQPNSTDAWTPSKFLNGPPTKRFRDNLRKDEYYITTLANAGFTNEFMGIVNMLYLSMLSNRIPILPPFAPHHHLPYEAGVIPFGDIFDLRHLRSVIQWPILEWRDVKELSSERGDPYSPYTVEPIGCWAASAELGHPPEIVLSYVHHLGLDVSFTYVLRNTRRLPDRIGDTHVLFAPLAALVYPTGPSVEPESLPLAAMSPEGSTLSPDRHLACFDTLYYTTSVAHQDFEWEYAWSPAWNFVGQHLKFTDPILQIATLYLRNLFNVSPGQELPQFIAIHIRRGDLKDLCSGEDCYQHLATYVKAVQEVREEILLKHGVNVDKVFVASDERSPEYWSDIKKLGWRNINHTEARTNERYGQWYPIIVDVVAQSLAAGFVGTSPSTFSLVSKRRVEVWNDGPTRMVAYAR